MRRRCPGPSDPARPARTDDRESPHDRHPAGQERADPTAAIVAAGVGWFSASLAYEAESDRLRTEYKTQFMAEEAIDQLLMQKSWRLRRFSTIKSRIRGFSDNELRQLLVRAGAVAFEGEGDGELWGLRSRNLDRLASPSTD